MMSPVLLPLLFALQAGGAPAVQEATPAPGNPVVHISTTRGDITVELFAAQAPVSVENFLGYVAEGFYDGTIFHRVIPGFVVQGGGLTFDFAEKKTNDPIKNESDNGLTNDHMTLSMARTMAPHSATSQFFINLRDNTSLDARPNRPGYAVFGKVIAGQEVVEKIAQQPRGRYKAFPEAPNEAIRILSARRVEQPSAEAVEDAQ
jgi:peptidyl-prolyl cis-trans isomerase A (cyclophilin A)